MIHRLHLPLETTPGKNRLTARYKRIFSYLLILCLSCYSFFVQAQAPAANFTASTVSGCAPLAVNFKDQSTGDPKFWNWDLGNGQLSNLQNPTAVYTSPGKYTVTLVVRNANGTNGITKTDYIVANPSPIVYFDADKTIACVPGTINFRDQSTDTAGTISKWAWDFGDGSTSNQKNPTHLFTDLGFYNVSLTVTSSTGCTNALGKYRYIRVVSGVTPDFNSIIDSVCRAPFGVTFSNQTSGPGNLTYNWDLGNGSTSTAKDPTTTYASAGTYKVTLSVQSEYGCSGSVAKSVSVTSTGTDFKFPDPSCIDQSINFQNASGKPPLKSQWDFGDGTGSTKIDPVKKYATTGTYTVKLVNHYGDCSDSVSKSIKVLPPPTVNFGADQQNGCKGPFTVNFKDLSPDATAWQWDFGDGGTSAVRNPSHTYVAEGDFNVKLTITSSSGCTSTYTQSAYIKIHKPEVNISNVPIGGCVPFDFRPIPDVKSIDGVASYSWDFGDGTTATGPTPSHIYPNPGNYALTLKIVTNGGCTASASLNQAVHTGTPPTVNFSVDKNSDCAFNTLSFTNLSNPSDQWLWDFGDNQTSTDKNPTHTYTSAGTFSVQLIAFNNGCPRAITKNAFIAIKPPVANFNDTIADCNSKRIVTFIDKSQTDPTVTPFSYLWDFGDGTTSSQQNPVHPYATYGIYNATLTITNGACTNKTTRTVIVSAQQADFIADKTSVCKNEFVNFKSLNSDPVYVSTYEWYIDGVLSYTGMNGLNSWQASFSTNGGHAIGLVVTDVNGCKDSKTVPNYITAFGPTADFRAIDTGGCKNAPIRFEDRSRPTGGLKKWQWNFGDGQVQRFTAPPFSHTYSDTGYYRVVLSVTDNQGCVDSLGKDSLVRITSPKAYFSATNTLFCSGINLSFSDSSSGYISRYRWSFGDGGTSAVQNPKHSYPGRDSSYTVKLVVTDTVGCMDSITRVNYIQIKSPKPAFDVSDTSAICPPLETKFTFKGSDYDSYSWDFGDGLTSALQNPRHFYNAYGKYVAKLYLVGYGGCLDSAMKTITVFNPYDTRINYSPLESCNELNVDFKLSPPGNITFYFYYGDGAGDSTQATTLSHFYKSPSFYSPYMLIKDKMDCQVTVGGPSVVKIYGAEPFFSLDKKAFCDSGTVNFTNFTIANDTIVSSIWNFGDGSTSTQRDAVHSFNTPGTYQVSLTAATTRGCSKTLYDTVKVSGTPQPIITSPDLICVNSIMDFNGSLVVPDTSIRWSWNLGDGGISSQQNTHAIYKKVGKQKITLEAANFLGCKRSTGKDIVVAPLPEINIFADPTVISGTGVVIPATYSSNVITYNWTPTKYLSCTDCPNPYAKPQFTTRYKVDVTDSNGCRNSRDITVTVICNDKNYFIPNTFSPNGDGVNDVFYPRGTGISRIQSLRIFNRWGEMVFEKKDFLANDASAGWNGLVRGKPAEQDVYIYVIEFICENAAIVPYRGNVALIR